jgi:hypothetical protein
MKLGSAFHVVTFSLLQVLTYIHDPLQIPSVTGTGQVQLQWGDVPPTVGNGAAQGALVLWNSHHGDHANVVNHRTADYPELVGVSDDVVMGTINLPIDLLVMQQDLASPYMHPNVGPAHQQGIPEHMQVMFHVGASLSLPHMFLIQFIVSGECRK